MKHYKELKPKSLYHMLLSQRSKKYLTCFQITLACKISPQLFEGLCRAINLNRLITNSMKQSPQEADTHSAGQEIPRLLWTRKFITVFTRAHHCSLSWARCIQSTNSHHISLRSILILFSHLRLGLPNSLFPSGFLTKILYAFQIYPMRTVRPAHLILLDLITLIIFGEAYKSYEAPPGIPQLRPS